MLRPLLSRTTALASHCSSAFRGAASSSQSNGLGRALRAWQPSSSGPVLGASLLGGAASQGALRPSAFTAAFGSMGQGPSALDQVTFKEMGVLSWLIIDLAINWGGWAVSSALQTDKFYDMLGTASFLTLGLGSMAAAKSRHWRKYMVSAMVGVWALRLGSFLVARVWKVGHDSRFDEAKKKPFTFWVYWTMQAAWVFVTLSPVLLLNTSGAGGPARFVWSDGVGVGLFALGLAIEAIADAQKFAFKMDPANKGRFIDSGLWKYARFPNYFGEMTLWWGVFITCTSGLSGAQFASVASPLFVFLLIRFVSGVPLQEAQAQRRWGATPEYQAYRESTNMLVPIPKGLLTGAACFPSKSQ